MDATKRQVAVMVRLPVAAKEQLDRRAAANDRSVSAECPRIVREHLEREM